MTDDRLQGAVDLRGNPQRQVRHRLDRSVPPQRHLELLRDHRHREQLGDWKNGLRVLGRERVGQARHEVQRADGPAFRQERHHHHRIEPRAVQHVGIEEVGGGVGHIPDDDRFPRPDHGAEESAVRLEHDLGARPGPPLLVVHPRRVGLELLAGLVQQRQADAIAGHQPRDPRRERLECQGGVDRLRDDLQHRILRLQLLDLAKGRLVGVLVLADAIR